MDLLGANPTLKMNVDSWRILSRHENAPPQYVVPHAVVENASVTEGCEILGTVRNSVLGANVRVMEGAVVEDAVLMGDTVVYENAKITYAIIDRDVKVGKNAVIGKKKDAAKAIAVVGEGVHISEGAVIEDGAMISE
jgi:glucose-1-phosphate adenylyltransferase